MAQTHKAEGFRLILGIGRGDLEYLARALEEAARAASVVNVRDNAPFGVLCEARVDIQGIHDRAQRGASVTTAWELRHAEDSPRLVTAFIDE